MTSFGPGGNDPSKIVITNDDLDSSIPLGPAGVRGGAANLSTLGGLPPVPPQPAPMPVHVPTPSGGTVLTRIGANSIVSGLVAGAVGGFIGFLFSENIYNPDKLNATT